MVLTDKGRQAASTRCRLGRYRARPCCQEERDDQSRHFQGGAHRILHEVIEGQATLLRQRRRPTGRPAAAKMVWSPAALPIGAVSRWRRAMFSADPWPDGRNRAKPAEGLSAVFTASRSIKSNG
jgi:hypothetical protein